MRGSKWIKTDEPPMAARRPSPGARRNAIAALLAALTAVCLAAATLLNPTTQFLMPGPLASAHGAIETCSDCHSKSGSGKVSWFHGLIAGDPLADSKACLICHKMPETAFNAHSASPEVLKASTKRLRTVAAKISSPFSARAQNIAFSTDTVVARDLYCATCHQEHQGANFNLKQISNEQCRSCHVVRFDSFDGSHPKFESFPYKRRQRIVFDHTGHFDQHFPEAAKKDKTKRIPETCSACHDSRADRRVMGLTKFDDTCATCHLDQITGKERASGPKGVAFLTLPGLDLETLNAKKAAIGEWPEDSEAALTPFMTMMLARDERGRALLKTVARLNLRDLSKASDGEVKAVGELAWEIKKLYHAFIAGKSSDVLSSLQTGTGVRLNAALVADLTASIPRDVIASAQKQWLPNLTKEMGGGADAAADDPPPEEASTTGDEPSAEDTDAGEEADGTGEDEASAGDSGEETAEGEEAQSPEGDDVDVTSSFAPPADGSANANANETLLDPPPCSLSILGQCLVLEEKKNSAQATVPLDDDRSKDEAGQTAEIRVAANDEQPVAGAANPKDELLFPTDEELRQIKAHYKAAGQAEPKRIKGGTIAFEAPETAAGMGGASDEGGVSEIDPESWADYGGWYRQDYAIYYKPVGHKDKFIYSWLVLTGFKAQESEGSPAAEVFKYLSAKDAQGACTKCHSIDTSEEDAKLVNFSPKKASTKQGRFTTFIHEPHLSIVDDRGCLTCHSLAKGPSKAATTAGADAVKGERPFLKGYAQGNPKEFVSGFDAIAKTTCTSCHATGLARQDCLTCHKYHVDGVVAPILSTKLPEQ